MKKAIAFLMLLCIAALGACTSDTAPGAAEAENHSVAKKEVFFYNSHRHHLDPDIPLPDSKRLDWDNTDDPTLKSYQRVSDKWTEQYYKTLEKSGFTVKRMRYGAFAKNEDSYLFLTYCGDDYYLTENGEVMNFHGFSQPKGIDGISRQEAKAIIPTKSELLPIDVTPEGLYDATGGQIFMQPEYSFDDEYYDNEPKDPESESYTPAYFYIVNGTAVKLDSTAVGVDDLDGDGMSETCFIGNGLTSGVFTFSIDVYRDGEPVSVGQCYEMNWQIFTFSEHDGKLCLTGNDSNGVHIYDIAIKDGSVVLSENGIPLEANYSLYY